MTRQLNKIMVVDDEVLICELLDEFLTVHGYQVTTAFGGEDAIVKFKTARPNMVLLDIRMQGMDGIAVLQTIKDIDRDAVVIMLSAFGDADIIQKAIQGGAYKYIQKPVGFGVLMNVIEGWRRL